MMKLKLYIRRKNLKIDLNTPITSVNKITKKIFKNTIIKTTADNKMIKISNSSR